MESLALLLLRRAERREGCEVWGCSPDCRGDGESVRMNGWAWENAGNEMGRVEFGEGSENAMVSQGSINHVDWHHYPLNPEREERRK